VRVPLAAATLLAALLAGCSGGGGEGGPNGPVAPDVEVDPDSRFGAVSGVVVDEAIRPVAGAVVQLLSDGRNTTTDEGGQFAFTQLEPGFYAMTATAPRYLATQASADVLPGDTAKVRVQLQPDPSPVPYHVTLQHDGFMQGWATIAEYEFQEVTGEAAPLCDCRLNFTPEAVPSTIVYEAYWEDTTPNPGGFEYYWVVEQQETGARGADYCASPCLAHISGSDFAAGMPAYARLDGPDEWVVANQPFELFVTLFYNGKAPEGWSIRDAA